MPLGPNIGGNNKRREISTNGSINKNYLTSKQADYIYRKVELGSLINKNTMKEQYFSVERQAFTSIQTWLPQV